MVTSKQGRGLKICQQYISEQDSTLIIRQWESVVGISHLIKKYMSNNLGCEVE